MVDLEYPEGLAETSVSARQTNDTVSFVRFEIFERHSATNYQLRRGINLYMPLSLDNSTTTSWDTQALGQGGAGQQGVVDANVDRLHKSYSALLESMTAKLYGGSEATAADLLANKNQAIVNPYTKMLFRGVNFRNFEMTFMFTPKIESESQIIWQICQEFRAAQLPQEEPDGFKWRYPREIEITYKYQGKDHPWLNKFKRCVVTDANVNYTGAGFYASMRDGFPAETELRLTFSEIELVTRADIETESGPSF